MKLLLLLIGFAATAIAQSPTPSPSPVVETDQAVQLRYVSTDGDRIQLALSDDGYNRSVGTSVSELSAPQQTVVTGALAFLATQIASGDTVTGISLEPSRNGGLRTVVSSSGPKGQRQPFVIRSWEAPDDISAPLIELWNALQTQVQPP